MQPVEAFQNNPLSVLIVEDNSILAFELEKTLTVMGVSTILTAGTQLSAFEVIQQTSLDAAILDINLGRDLSFDIATSLVSQQIPVIFLSGYDQDFKIPEPLESCVRLAKPLDPLKLSESLQMLVNSRFMN